MNMSKEIPDYWEGDPGDEQEEIPLTAMELSEMIEQKLEGGTENKPKGWKKEVNSLIETYNTRYGHIYKKV